MVSIKRTIFAALSLFANASNSAKIIKAARLLDPRTGNVISPAAVLIDNDKTAAAGAEIAEHIMLKWRLVEEGHKSGHAFAQPDLIAATALHHSLTIVCRDTREYEQTNLLALNRWMATG